MGRMTVPNGTIRPFDPNGNDYADLARILAATGPDAGLDEAGMRVHDRDWDHARFETWRYLVLPFVHLDAQRRGWVTALLAHAEAFVRD